MNDMSLLNRPPVNRLFNNCQKVISFVVSITIIITGCTSTRIVSASNLKLKLDFCVSPSLESYNYQPAMPVNTDSLLRNGEELAAYLSRQEILTANATGTLAAIKQLIDLGKDSTDFNEKRLLLYSIEIQKNISLVRSEVDALSAELECEAFRTRQLSAYIGALNSKRNSKITVAAIAVGSLSTMLPVVINGKTGVNAIAVSGGITSAGLGALSLKSSNYKLKMTTWRNLLGNIWHGDTVNRIYPNAVWYFLNEPGFGSLQKASKAQVMKMRWLKFDLNGSLDAATEQVLFGNGGIFNQYSLDARANMLSELVAEINSIPQYLDKLIYKIDDIKIKLLHTVCGQ